MKPQTISVPGPNNVKLVLDPQDPHTPAMIYAGPAGRDGLGRYTNTYDCATEQGCVDDVVELTRAQQDFLGRKSDLVESYIDFARSKGSYY